MAEEKIDVYLFPRLNRLLRDLNNPEISFSAILGAGVSVPAGYSAFRSTNSVFYQMQHEYKTWPDKSNEDDSFLLYAFSVRSVLNDPRVHYRVLHKFNESVHGRVVSPTLTHCFLTYLAEIGRLVNVVTYNVDKLEEAAGLRKLLGDNLIEAHGIFSGPGMCPNTLCPACTKVGEMRSKDKLESSHQELEMLYRELFYLPEKSMVRKESVPDHDLKIDINSIRFAEDIFMQAIRDDCVPCCPFCGCSLKSSMIMYGEEVNIDNRALNYMFFESQSLLVIGTSMNVYPISMLPLTVSGDVPLHFIAKYIDFHRYLNLSFIDDKRVFVDLIYKRYDRCKYKGTEKLRSTVFENLEGQTLSQEQLDVALNKLTPNFCFHKGEADALVQYVLEVAPEMSRRVREIYRKCAEEAVLKQKRNNIVLYADSVEYGDDAVDIQQIILAVPQLFPPDAIIYEYNDSFAITCVCTTQQIEIIYRWFGSYVVKEKTKDQQLVLLDSRYKRKTSLYDQTVYRPIGGHWACYCMGYNAYDLLGTDYVEELDPWSSNFVGYRQKGFFCERAEFFCYSGVYRNYITVKEARGAHMVAYFKHTKDLLSDYARLARPIISK